MTLVRLEPIAPWSGVKHSITEPLEQSAINVLLYFQALFFQNRNSAKSFIIRPGFCVILCRKAESENPDQTAQVLFQ